MKEYKYDYDKKTFKEIRNNYYIRTNKNYIKVEKSIYKLIKSSYDKIRYTYKKELAESVTYYDDIDSASFFVLRNNEKSLAEKIYIHDLYMKVVSEINNLPERDKNIAYLSFLYEYSDSEISRVLDIPRTTVSYRKKKIQEKIRKVCQFK